MNNYQPYTYLIAWSDHNLYYYGVRYAEGCHPGDFWKTYFTSSQRVQEARELYGDPDIIQIRKTFKDSDSARKWETTVLRRMKVKLAENWLNQNDNQAPRWDESHREAHLNAVRGRKYSEEGKKKLSERNKKQWADPEMRKKRTEGVRRAMQNPETREKIAEFQRGQTRSEEHKQKIREMRKQEWQDEAKTVARKRAISDAIRAKWQDPKYRAKMMQRRKG